MSPLPKAEKKIPASIMLPPRLKRQLAAYADEHDLSMSTVVTLALRKYLAENYPKTIESHQISEGDTV